jgi:hypothetical protein
MAPNKKDKTIDPTQRLQEQAPNRHRTLMQRLSSSFSSFTTNMPIRKARPNSKANSRPETAPADHTRHDKIRRRTGQPNHQHSLSPHIDIPKLSDSDCDCPYDPSSHHSFPDIESKGCICCGVRPPSRANSSRSCSHCRSRTRLSHLASSFTRPHRQRGSSSAVPSNFGRLLESSALSEQIPRVVSTAVAAKRKENPLRTSSLPEGRVPSYSTSNPSSSQEANPSELQEYIANAFSRTPPSVESHPRSLGRLHARPVSPKLHHLHGLPGARHHPYMHRHEVDSHIAAIRAGSPSPLRHPIHKPQRTANPSQPYQDFSRTVYYGSTTHVRRSSYSSHFSPPSGSQYTSILIESVQSGGNIVIEESRRGGIPSWQFEVEHSVLYRRQSPRPDNDTPVQPDDDGDSDSFSTLSTQDPTAVGGKRIELLGGSERPRLRGGGDHLGLGFRLKKWLLTCHAPFHSRHEYDTDSDADLPAPQAPCQETVRRALRTSRGRVTVPGNVVRWSADTSQTGTSVTSSMESDTAGPNTTIQPLSYHLPHPQTPTPPIPHLRGGASSEIRLPRTLYWLAGGTGRSVTICSWQKQRGKKRMGGLLGMAMNGARAGTEYEVDNASEENVNVGSAGEKVEGDEGGRG